MLGIDIEQNARRTRVHLVLFSYIDLCTTLYLVAFSYEHKLRARQETPAAERSSDKVRYNGLACTNRVLGIDIEQKCKRD